ncbi:MAG: hypothetical protein MUO97_04420, partial [Dehalococcoidia bacterium]|nr:hypothetical protein [Dehalococcoidia bacterium]
VKKWIKWLGIIEVEVQQLLIAKDIFWTVQNLIKRNKRIQKPSSFYRYLGDTYVSHVLMGIRRQVKIDRQSISLARLLSEIASDPKRISRNYYKTLYIGSTVEAHADRDFDKFCGDDPNCISVQMVTLDLEHLREVTKKCENFADRRIAHRDKHKPNVLPKFIEVDECIEVLDKLCVKYHSIFHAAWTKSLMPTYQYDWLQIFNEPWNLLEEELSSDELI